MEKFIARENELRSMEGFYQKPGFQMLVIYGRRRIGKTTLIQKFEEGKQYVHYTAVKNSLSKNLELFSRRIVETIAPELSGIVFQSFEDLFHFLGQRASEERIVVVIDELPYLAEQDAGILSTLQKYIDEEWIQTNLFFVACGSSVSFMEENVLGEKSPLFGRRTGQIKLRPFNYYESSLFVPNYTPEDKAVCYGLTGGVPKYLALLDEKKTLDENIEELFFSPNGYLYEEPSNLLAQEFRNVSLYTSVIGAIANGSTKVREISDKTHVEQSAVSHALANLMTTDIVKKEVPLTDEKNKKKVQYCLQDAMFRFWYRFVQDGAGLIETGAGSLYYQNMVKPYLSEYMGSVFEDICREYMLHLSVTGKLNLLVNQIGKWWGTNPVKKEETDIDVVGINTRTKQAVIGECKYTNDLFDKTIYDNFMDRRNLLNHKYTAIQFLCFAKSGFSDWVTENAPDKTVKLVDLKQLYQW